jgi:ligand-binding sensor domain-containing protein
MSTYLGTKGVKIQSLASDPTLIEGTVWYNTTSGVLKFYNGSSAQTVTTT